MKKKFDFPLVDFDIVEFPMVMATFITKSGKRVGGAFIIDTASQHNVLNESILAILDDASLIFSDQKTLTSFEGKGVPANEVHLDFKIEDAEFDERFYAAQGLSFDSVFGKHVVLGILGVEFLAKYDLALDFEQKSIHTSSLIESEIDLNEYDFLFPQEFGFKNYGLPVVGIVKGDNEYVCLVDSGSNLNTTTYFVLKDGPMDYKTTGKRSSLTSVAGTNLTNIVQMQFDLLSIADKAGEIKKCPFLSEFQVIDNSKFLVDGADEIPPISAIIGSGFLLEHKWVIDFAAGLVVSVKNKKI